jgi:EAL domain-containing protein (putative c-di-GMP-specific phosphodiesterase class I)
MPSLTRWVLKTVVKEARRWQDQGIKLAVAVNLSAYDLADDELLNYVNELLKSHNLSPSYLILEVTESAVMKDPKHAINILHRLKSAGIKLAIDDFGTGYSSLAQLKSMPVDELKIDKSFVLKLDQSPDDLVIVRSTIELGHNMGMAVIAEGVENQEAWDLLEANGCDMLQGYFISRPLPPLDFIEWYQSSEFKQTT